MDGASRFTMLRTVVFPLLVPGMVATAMFTFVSAWNEFFFALVLLQSPENFTLSRSLALFVGAEGQVPPRPARRRRGPRLDPQPDLLRHPAAPPHRRSAVRRRQGLTRSTRTTASATRTTRPTRTIERRTMNLRRIAAAGLTTVLAASLAACGGGGSGSARTPTPAPSPSSSSRWPSCRRRRRRPRRSSTTSTRPTRTSKVDLVQGELGQRPRPARHAVRRRHRAGHHPRRVGRHDRLRAGRLPRRPQRARWTRRSRATISPGVSTSVTVDGKVIAAPTVLQSYLVFANKKLLDEAGATMPDRADDDLGPVRGPRQAGRRPRPARRASAGA